MATDPTVKNAGEAALAEKRKALSLLDQIERQESRCAMQLTTLEATLDTACLTLRQLQSPDSASSSVERVRRDLRAEIAAIAEQELAQQGE